MKERLNLKELVISFYLLRFITELGFISFLKVF